MLSIIVLAVFSGIQIIAAHPFTASCKPFEDNFDSIPQTNPVASLNPIGIVNGTNYKGWNIGRSGGIGVQNGTNTAATTTAGGLINVGQVAVYPMAYIIRVGIKSFDLYSFYYGPALGRQVGQIPSVTLPGTIVAYGYNTDDQMVGAQTFGFSSSGQTNVPMNEANIAGFKNMKNVTIGLAAAILPVDTVVAIDQVEKSVYYCLKSASKAGLPGAYEP